MVPLFDLKRQYQALKPEVDAAVIAFLESGQYVVPSGAHPAVVEFENAAARALGVRHAVGVANGSDALLLSLRALGIGPGDEVITTPFTFIATAEMVSLLGAVPVFVDIEPRTFNLDPALVEAAITPRTKAVLPVHLFGHPAAMPGISAVAAAHGLKVVEDAAQAWGAALEIDGQPRHCGTLGDVAAFSFFPSKNLGSCGEGGMVTTNDAAIAERVRMLRSHGQSQRYLHHAVGYNSRLHALQAVILNAKLPRAHSWNERRRATAARYGELLAGLPLQLPCEQPGARHVFHQYTLRVSDAALAGGRHKVTDALTEAGVGWAIYYPMCLHLQPVYSSLGYREGQFPVAEEACRQVLSLPIFPELSDDEVAAVAAALRLACGS